MATPSRIKVAHPTFDAQQAFKELDRSDDKVFWIDNQDPELRIFMWCGRPMAARGHNHVLVATQMEAAVTLHGRLHRCLIPVTVTLVRRVAQDVDTVCHPPNRLHYRTDHVHYRTDHAQGRRPR